MKFRNIFALFVVLSLTGCANVGSKRDIAKQHPKLKQTGDELYEISMAQWVDFEKMKGSGMLIESAKLRRDQCGQISDPERRERAEQFLTNFIEEASDRYVSELEGISEIAMKMLPGDKLFYSQRKESPYSYIYIVRHGTTVESFRVTCCWEDGEVNAMWQAIKARDQK